MAEKENYEQWKVRTALNVIPRDQYPTTYPVHWHKYVEFVIYPLENDEVNTSKKKKTAKIRVGQDIYQMKPGDFLVAWPGELHEVIINPDKQLFGIQFPITAISEIRDFALCINMLKRYHLLKYEENPELLEHLISCACKIADLDQREEPFSEAQMVIHLFEFFIEWGKFAEAQKKFNFELEGEVKSKQTMEKFELACAYIHDNCDSNITLESVANYIGFSPCYFSRYFKKVTTHKFVDYLTHQRIKQAQMLLTNSDLSMTEVAFQSGFKSISTFNRVFREYNGCSPSKYKKYNDDES